MIEEVFNNINSEESKKSRINYNVIYKQGLSTLAIEKLSIQDRKELMIASYVEFNLEGINSDENI